MKTIIKAIFCFIGLSLMVTGCYYDDIAGFEGLPTNVSFKNDVDPIFSKNCVTSGCHDAIPSHDPSLVSENSYNSLIEGQYVNTTEPEKSTLYVALNSGMPPSGPLSVNDMKIILAWITEGAKNN